jgi:spermidine synthase
VLKKFPLLFLVLLIEGGALMAVELMGAKLVAPFYGNSLYVWTAVLTITVLGLTLGYYAGGRVSKEQPSETKLFVVLAISALLVLALPLTASLSIALTKGMGLLPGICVTCVLLLLPPMVCFGIVGPMVVSLMSSQLETVGKTAGTVYFTSTLGGIAVTFLLGLYLIPVAGLRLCATITGLALAALPVIYILKRLLSGRASPGSSAFVRPRRDKPIPATNERSKIPNKKSESKGKRSSVSRPPTIRRTIYLFAVLEGATVMAVELLSARMVAPYFGSALYVWGTVIGFTLLALAIGYFAGGVIADKYSGPDTLLWLLLTASLFLILMHVSAPLLTIAFANLSPSVAVVLVSMALILPPLIFLGMVPTFLIRRVSTTAESAGRSTGAVYAISSGSGIFALPVFGFFIIPRFGLTLPSIITGLVVGMIPFVKLVGQKRYLSLLWIPFALFSFWAIKTQHPGKAVDVKYYSEGLLGQVLVADVPGGEDQKSGERMVMMNRMVQTLVDEPGLRPKSHYIYYAYSICSKLPEKSDVLILGLGGGILAKVFQNNLGFNVDAVELDPRIAEVARQYFALGDRVNVIIDDARHYLEETQKKYDVIFFDVYRGELPPPHVFTLESLAKTKSLLTDAGLIVVNFNGYLDGKIGAPARSIYKTLVTSGLDVRILSTPGAEAGRNLLFVASKERQDFHTVRSPLLLNGKQVDIETVFLDARKVDLSDAVVLTDDKPILELLNIQAGNAWRQGYTEMTKRFYQEGVPLFR